MIDIEYENIATNVSLTSELERFARECVEGGRYNNVNEVVRASPRLLQEAEDRRCDFLRMLRTADEEADREARYDGSQTTARRRAYFAESVARGG